MMTRFAPPLVEPRRNDEAARERRMKGIVARDG